MSSPAFLDPTDIETFSRDGVLVLRNFYDAVIDIEPVQRAIHAIIGQVMKRHGVADARGPFDSGRFDDGYAALIATDRGRGGEVYDAIKQIPAFLRLVADRRHERIFRDLRPGSLPGIAAGGHGIRIDNPGEDRFRAHWHQEYPAQLRSLDGLVFWSPLVTMTQAMGPVRFCEGSHINGLVPVISGDPDNVGRTGAYALSLHEEEKLLADYVETAPLTEPSDLIVVDFLTLHASGFNRGDRARWSMQFRYFNFDDPTGISHGWKGSFANGIDFREIHPELFVEGSHT